MPGKKFLSLCHINKKVTFKKKISLSRPVGARLDCCHISFFFIAIIPCYLIRTCYYNGRIMSEHPNDILCT